MRIISYKAGYNLKKGGVTMFWLGLGIGVFIGGNFGLLIMALFKINKN